MSGEALIRKLRSLRIMVYHPRDISCDELVRHIQRIGCRVGADWPVPDEWPSDVEAVFCYFDETGCWKPRSSKVPVIAVIEYESPTVVRTLLGADVQGIITKPIRPFGILSTLVLARSHFEFEARQQAKIAKLEETLRSRRLVERAASALAEASGRDVQECYHIIRREAMERRVSMASLAEDILAHTAEIDLTQR
ncbi:ANTAR domain-containing response regulator [Microvirga massiliensis]|uniref:ANTAR domain-containing response regulator n=1 Tax=Microvirga massiliensis TaxID=1033741 RepID=UPI00062B9524|nr:ANTAR domain-containing protein [Microvirga massiliensis]